MLAASDSAAGAGIGADIDASGGASGGAGAGGAACPPEKKPSGAVDRQGMGREGTWL